MGQTGREMLLWQPESALGWFWEAGISDTPGSWAEGLILCPGHWMLGIKSSCMTLGPRMVPQEPDLHLLPILGTLVGKELS